MSPLSTERLSVFLSPFELVAVRWRGWAQRIVDKRIHPVPEGDPAAAVKAFGSMLNESACKRVRVIVSSHLTQYQLIPWRDDLNDAEEEQAAARLAFAETFGEPASRWSIRLSDEPPGAPRVAAAIEAGLLDAMEQAAAAAQARLVSVQPYLTAAANSWRGHLGHGRSSWLVLHERYRACLALIERGRWRWLRCVRVGADWSERLPELIEHEMLLAGVDAPREVLVFAPSEPALAVRCGTRLPVRSLRLEERAGFSPLNDGRFAQALVG